MHTSRLMTVVMFVPMAACARTRDERVKEDASTPPPAVASSVNAATSSNLGARPVIQVWKSPTCGCCSGWVDHLKAAGYTVQVEDVLDLDAVKRARGIPGDLTSCHTALVGGYLVEGHVPADVIDRLLAEHPDVDGIAVPGMPVGAPGMEVPGQSTQPYDVIAFKANGDRQIYERR